MSSSPRLGPESLESLAEQLLQRLAAGTEVPAQLLRLIGATMASEAALVLSGDAHALDHAATWARRVRCELEAERLLGRRAAS